MNHNERTVALIPARLDSTRLPRKQLRPIRGKAMLWYLVERMESVPTVDEVVIATTDRAVDDPLVTWATDHDVAVFRGAHQDVLQRFYSAATEFHAETVVRANGDNPFLSPRVTTNGIERLQDRDLEFVTGKRKYTDLPVGIGPEVLRTKTLATLLSATTNASDREHVTSYIFDHTDEFRWDSIPVADKWKAATLSVTVDTTEDLQYVRNVVRQLPSCHPSEWGIEEINEACRHLTTNDTNN